MPKAPTKSDLEDELEADAIEYFDGGRQNYWGDIALTISAVVTSLIAAAVAATDVSKWLRVGVAAVPAACTSIQKILEVKARANWYFTYAARLRALGATLKYTTDPKLEDFAKKKAFIDLTMDKSWSQIGRSGAKPRVGGRAQQHEDEV
jgi:hypothetical protein